MSNWLIILLIIVIILIVGIRLLSFRHQKKVKKHLNSVISSSPYRKTEHMPTPLNDFLLRSKEQEVKKQEELSSGVVKYDPHGLYAEQAEQHEQSQVVGVAEPKGFWSKFIMSQKLGYIIARMGAQHSSDKGFWVKLIKAQSMSQGKDQSRGR